MNIKRFIAAFLLIAGSLFVTVAPAGAATNCDPAQAASNQCGTYPAPNPATTVPCEEDQPCWNCNTMGNLQCGTTTTTAAATTTTIPAKSDLPLTGGDIRTLVLIGLGVGLVGVALVGVEKKRKNKNV